MNPNIDEIVDIFEKIEIEENLFEIKVKGIPVWELIRFQIFSEIQSKILNESQFREKSIIFNNLHIMIYNFIKSYFQLKSTKKADFLILNHPRRIKFNQEFIDIYVDTFVNKLPGSFIILENMFQLNHIGNVSNNNLIYLDYVKLPVRILSKFYLVKLDKTLLEKINEIENKFRSEFKIKIEIGKKIREEFTRFIFLEKKFNRILKRINPKLIIEVVNYSRVNKIFNFIAKKNNITTVEIQHGTMGKLHLGYSYPDIVKNKLLTYPDFIFVWSNYWKENTRFPIENNNIIVTGFPYFENILHQSIIKERKDILVISQPTISRKLSIEIEKLAKELLNTNPEVLIYFKLHPSESVNSEQKFQNLYKYSNILIIDGNEISLYELFMRCKIQVGVYSTALFEGIGFGLKTFILKLPGWEYFKDIINENIILIDDVFEVIENFNVESSGKTDSSIFWEKGSVDKMLEAIKILTISYQ